MPVLGRRFLPARSRLKPEDLRRNVAVPCISEQKARHLGVGLRRAEIELVTVVLAQGFRIDADHARDVVLRDAVGGHGFNLPALGGIGRVHLAAHAESFAGCRSAATVWNDRPSPSSLALSPGT